MVRVSIRVIIMVMVRSTQGWKISKISDFFPYFSIYTGWAKKNRTILKVYDSCI